MSRTVSRGLVYADRWSSVASTIIEVITLVVSSRRCTGQETGAGAYAALHRFLDAALSGVEYDRTNVIRVGPHAWSTSNASIALEAAMDAFPKIKKKSVKEFESFLRTTLHFGDRLAVPHNLTKKEIETANRTKRFLEAVVGLGVNARACRRYEIDDDD